MAEQTQQERYLSGLWESMKQRSAGLATTVGPGVDTKSLTPLQHDQLWDERFLTIEQEWKLWEQGRTPETAGQPILSPEEIGMRVFANREKLAKTGGRLEPSAWYAYTSRMAARAEARRQGADTGTMGPEMATAMGGASDGNTVD